jgi:hypothetical protein
MKTQITLLFALTIAFFTGCKIDEPLPAGDDDPTEYDFVVFGKYNGMCAGDNCVEVFKMENGNLYEDTSNLYPGDGPYQGTYVQMPAAKYDLVKNLLNQIPSQLLNEPNGTFGIPDAYDQGGFIVEVKENGTLKHWRIDTNPSAIPAYLAPFNTTLRNYINAIH